MKTATVNKQAPPTFLVICHLLHVMINSNTAQIANILTLRLCSSVQSRARTVIVFLDDAEAKHFHMNTSIQGWLRLKVRLSEVQEEKSKLNRKTLRLEHMPSS